MTVGFRLSQWVTYDADRRLMALSLALSGSALVVYLGYFDILAPAIPHGSVRANSGSFFIVPVFLLVAGQTLIDTWLTHTSVALAAPEKRDALKAYFVASLQVLLFSLIYVVFPFYGPYTFVIYFMPGESFGPLAYPILVLWVFAVVLVTAKAATWAFGLRNDARFRLPKMLLLSATTLAIILVAAS